MQIQHMKWTMGAVWVLIALVIGFTTGVNTPGGLLVFFALALLPPLALLLLWNDPAQSMSESIQQARRP